MSVQERIEPEFQPLGTFVRSSRSSDTEYIERIRTSLWWWDRWRWTGMAFYVVLIVALICMGLNLADVVREMQIIAPPELLVFIGVGVGASLGFSLHHCLWGLFLMLSGMRSERLLIRYRDRFGELPDE